MDTNSEPETPAPAEISAAPEPAPQLAAQKDDAIPFDSAFGEVDSLSETEDAEFMGCEAVIMTGWYTFVDVGLALAKIRDGRLYRVHFQTFEAYCQAKWQYGRNYVNRLITAAQVFTHLVTISHQRKPERETQVRPLVGLTPAQALLAWDFAAEKAGKREITARLVKSAMRELQLGSNTQPPVQLPRATKRAQRRAIDDDISQLLTLLSQRASHETLTEKLECLYRHIQDLFAHAPRRRA